ncbi:hypothetical protein N7451_005603 [Penicillium sp. IBT 35674x]|nr:hypothetical protein N7451_005603 [Penicillium sp. IBT 35674x]
MGDKLHLTFACGSYDRMDALANRVVEPVGIDLDYITIHRPREIFDRMSSMAFRHSNIVVNLNIIDLNGKKIGVQVYTMTAAVWIRGILQDAGVDLSTIAWIEGDLIKSGSHGKAKPKPLLRPISRMPNESPKSLNKLLEDGDIAATVGAHAPVCLGEATHIRRLFSNIRKTEKEYYQRTEIIPIMDLIVIKRDVVGKHPFVPHSLYQA